jgi:hypothetical protein
MNDLKSFTAWALQRHCDKELPDRVRSPISHRCHHLVKFLSKRLLSQFGISLAMSNTADVNDINPQVGGHSGTEPLKSDTAHAHRAVANVLITPTSQTDTVSAAKHSDRFKVLACSSNNWSIHTPFPCGPSTCLSRIVPKTHRQLVYRI